MAYYDNLSNAIDKLKRSLPDRTHKKTITYITNDGSRRSTYSKRGTSLVLSAMELELQTHCAVSVEVKPSWVKGKCHSYRSENKELAGAEDQTSVPTVQVPGPSGDNRGCVPAAKSPVRVSRKPSLKATLNKNPPCRMCGAREDVSFWLGCGYRNPKTKKQDCPYWVHQNCIGLFYKQEGDLESVPFFCPKHGK